MVPTADGQFDQVSTGLQVHDICPDRLCCGCFNPWNIFRTMATPLWWHAGYPLRRDQGRGLPNRGAFCKLCLLSARCARLVGISFMLSSGKKMGKNTSVIRKSSRALSTWAVDLSKSRKTSDESWRDSWPLTFMYASPNLILLWDVWGLGEFSAHTMNNL